jgi:hypothetical protein
MYQHVVHHIGVHRLSGIFQEMFGLRVYNFELLNFKRMIADKYRCTYDEIRTSLKTGTLIHADETPVRVKPKGKGYVWVFAGLEDVIYLYRHNREGEFLRDFLDGFTGVLVSDFYAAYDSLACAQQKCLIHFIRDLNNDLLRDPFNEELKCFAAEFSSLMKSIVATIDHYGLKESRLRRFRRPANRLVDATANAKFESKAMQSYSRRVARYGDRLFTFLQHNEVPWNNAHAEHAVREFAFFRASPNGHLSVSGLESFLVILSLYQTCQSRGIHFLDFLLSGELSINGYSGRRRRRQYPPALAMYPPGVVPAGKAERHPRRQTVDRSLRIQYLLSKGKTPSEVCHELGITPRQIAIAQKSIQPRKHMGR